VNARHLEPRLALVQHGIRIAQPVVEARAPPGSLHHAETGQLPNQQDRDGARAEFHGLVLVGIEPPDIVRCLLPV
jgi:hypothetical protein